MSYTYLPNLKPFSSEWKIIVKIIRLWKAFTAEYGETIEMVIVDEKVGSPVMLLRNIDAKSGLCNGTRLQVTQLLDHVIEAKVITGNRLGDIVFIGRMAITPSTTKIPFKMRHIQYPLALAFAMTINKSQGQTISKVGLYLPRPVFSHGQLYVAISRVNNKSGLKILITDKEGKVLKQTMNVVYKEVFRNL